MWIAQCQISRPFFTEPCVYPKKMRDNTSVCISAVCYIHCAKVEFLSFEFDFIPTNLNGFVSILVIYVDLFRSCWKWVDEQVQNLNEIKITWKDRCTIGWRFSKIEQWLISNRLSFWIAFDCVNTHGDFSIEILLRFHWQKSSENRHSFQRKTTENNSKNGIWLRFLENGFFLSVSPFNHFRAFFSVIFYSMLQPVHIFFSALVNEPLSKCVYTCDRCAVIVIDIIE